MSRKILIAVLVLGVILIVAAGVAYIVISRRPVQPKPPVLWMRGAADLVVSDSAMWDIAALGAMGFVPGWPGADECPAQPMLQQTRAVLDKYQANGGTYRAEVIADAGHCPFIEKPTEFNALFHGFLKEADS